uniref:BART domain-containing protein n=1 Tax=Alexandrium catenella TaxID=2925 RepID=A0A7S1S848_ALECA
MSKFERFGLSGGHGGFPATATLPQGDRLNTLLPEFKAWFAAVNGFGEYLRNFFAHYQNYFDAYAEEHSLVYTQLHKEFSANLEQSIDQWLHIKGLSEDDFGEMMQLAKARGDGNSDQIVGTLLGMLDYQLWITSIFALKHDSLVAGLISGSPPVDVPQEQQPAEQQAQVLNVEVPEGVAAGQQLQVTSPDGQALLVVVPEGLGAGQLFSVTYMPIAAA